MIALLLFLTAGAAEAPDLTGAWAMELRQSSVAKVPVIGRTRSTTVSLSLAEIVASEGGYLLRQVPCAVEVEGGGPAKTVIPQAFVDALPRSESPLEVTAAGDAWTVVAELPEAHIGYDPALAAGLPQSADDPAVLDSDGDGRPGATVRLEAGILGKYGIEVVQTSQVRLEGTLQEDGSIAGRVVTGSLDQHVIGADHAMLRTSLEIMPDDAGSSFRLVRSEAARNCPDLLAEGLPPGPR